MSLAGVVAWVMLFLLIGWVLIVLWATFHQIGDEARAGAERRREED